MAQKYARIFVSGFQEVNCELRGTDNLQGQISEHIFAAKLRLLCFPLLLKIRKYPRIFPRFSWGIKLLFAHVTCLDQSLASENIWWTINMYIFIYLMWMWWNTYLSLRFKEVVNSLDILLCYFFKHRFPRWWYKSCWNALSL